MSWNEVKNNTSNGSSSGDKMEFIKVAVGTTVRMRVIDEAPESRWVHRIPQAQGGKGISVTCIGKGCPICADIAAAKKTKAKSKYNSQKKHTLNVIDRETNTVKVLDQGNKVFTGLLTVMEQMGDLRNYDVTITKQSENSDPVVLPKYPPVPLTDAEKALPRYDLKEITKPYSAEQILAFMDGKTKEEVAALANGNTPTTSDNSNMSVDFTRQA
jgi:hypothetical protein